MKGLLLEELKRAVDLIENKSEEPLRYSWSTDSERAEIKQLLHAIRRHSIIYEGELYK